MNIFTLSAATVRKAAKELSVNLAEGVPKDSWGDVEWFARLLGLQFSPERVEQILAQNSLAAIRDQVLKDCTGRTESEAMELMKSMKSMGGVGLDPAPDKS